MKIGDTFWCCFDCWLLEPAAGEPPGKVRNCTGCVPGITQLCDHASFELELARELLRRYPNIDPGSIHITWADDGVPAFTACVRDPVPPIILRIAI